MARWRSGRHSRAQKGRNARARSNNRRLASGVRLRHDGVSSPRRGVKLVWQIDERESDPLARDPGNLAPKPTSASLAMTRRNCCGTKAGSSTQIAQPSDEMFKT